MWKKNYVIESFDGDSSLIIDLREFIEEYGIKKMQLFFGDGFERRKFSVFASHEEMSGYHFKNKDGLSSTCQFVIKNTRGSVVPIGFILNEFINDFPRSPESVSYFNWVGFFHQKMFWGSSRYKRRRKGGRGKRFPKYRHYQKSLESVKHDDIEISLVRAKQKYFVQSATDWYQEYNDIHVEKNWKNYRKTQYK